MKVVRGHYSERLNYKIALSASKLICIVKQFALHILSVQSDVLVLLYYGNSRHIIGMLQQSVNSSSFVLA